MPRRRPPEEITAFLHTLDSLKAGLSGFNASDVSCPLNHIGIAERSLGAVHQMMSTLGTVPLDRFFFSRKGGPPGDSTPPRAA